MTAEQKQENQSGEYRVLARKYRPKHFDEMIGQDALVQTLRNALDSGRIHHAYMLHGIRGVGKTTTARIMARALNYGERDAKPTADFKEITDQCQMIIEGRHVDVIEMDAASNTGVDNIRELIDGVQYAPAYARYKVYIIDEVHMLSNSAFNALLKTLEEPPAHVKFIFATTEIRKVPVTVLSRCQRFDLKRVGVETLHDYYGEIAKREDVKIDDDALTMIARAADGSVRDGLSLLDQAIALGDGTITSLLVRDMLGLADRAKILDLFEACVRGQAKEALDMTQDLYKSGADAKVVLEDLLEMCHVMTKAKSLQAEDLIVKMTHSEKERAHNLAAMLSVPILTRLWQVLLKGMAELIHAPSAYTALEMIVLRLVYTSDIPTAGDLVKMIEAGKISAPVNNDDNTPDASKKKL